MEPAMQLFLVSELARFVANIFEVVERCMCYGGQQSMQPRKSAACHCSIRKTMACLSRSFKKRPHLIQIKNSEWLTFLLIQANDLGGEGNRRASAGTDGCGCSQVNCGGNYGTQSRKPSRALAFFQRGFLKAKVSARSFHGA